MDSVHDVCKFRKANDPSISTLGTLHCNSQPILLHHDRHFQFTDAICKCRQLTSTASLNFNMPSISEHQQSMPFDCLSKHHDRQHPLAFCNTDLLLCGRLQHCPVGRICRFSPAQFGWCNCGYNEGDVFPSSVGSCCAFDSTHCKRLSDGLLCRCECYCCRLPDLPCPLNLSCKTGGGSQTVCDVLSTASVPMSLHSGSRIKDFENRVNSSVACKNETTAASVTHARKAFSDLTNVDISGTSVHNYTPDGDDMKQPSSHSLGLKLGHSDDRVQQPLLEVECVPKKRSFLIENLLKESPERIRLRRNTDGLPCSSSNNVACAVAPGSITHPILSHDTRRFNDPSGTLCWKPYQNLKKASENCPMSTRNSMTIHMPEGEKGMLTSNLFASGGESCGSVCFDVPCDCNFCSMSENAGEKCCLVAKAAFQQCHSDRSKDCTECGRNISCQRETRFVKNLPEKPGSLGSSGFRKFVQPNEEGDEVFCGTEFNESTKDQENVKELGEETKKQFNTERLMRPIEVIQLVRGLSAFMNELHKPNPLLLMDKELENLLNQLHERNPHVQIKVLNEGFAIRDPEPIEKDWEVVEVNGKFAARNREKGVEKVHASKRKAMRYVNRQCPEVLCIFCKSRSGDAFDMTRHTRTHTQVKPYNCTHRVRSEVIKDGRKEEVLVPCHERFSQNVTLELHCEKKHSIPRPPANQARVKEYICEFDGARFQDGQSYLKYLTQRYPNHSHLSKGNDRRIFRRAKDT